MNATAKADRSRERRDPLLAFTGHAARGVLKDINRLPHGQRVKALDNVLSSYDSRLPAKVRQVASKLRSEGMSTNMAVERAVALSLADATVDKLYGIGKARRAGQPPVGLYGLGLGQDSTGGETAAETNAKKKVGQMFQGIVCADGVQTAVTDLVGRNKGSDAAGATNLGYEVAQGFAQCTTPTAPPTPPPTPSASEDDGGSLALPIAIGAGALVVVGGAIWYTRRKA